MTDLATRAATLARRLHAGQTDKLGRPYVEHLEAVVGILLRRWPDAPEEAVAAAWLHDALEDTGATRRSLYEAGIPLGAILIVEDLTRPKRPSLSYFGWLNWLARWSSSPWAIRIKLADIEHNMDQPRARGPNEMTSPNRARGQLDNQNLTWEL